MTPHAIYFLIITLSTISVLNVARTLFNQRFYDDISIIALESSGKEYTSIIWDIVIVVSIVVITRILYGWLESIKSKISDKYEEKIEYTIIWNKLLQLLKMV